MKRFLIRVTLSHTMGLSSTSPQNPNREPSPALFRLKRLLRQILRITINDGRVFIGTFAGTDQPLNLLLLNTEEYNMGPDANPDGRYVGQVLIPWRLVVKVEGEGTKQDRLAQYF